MHAARPTTRCLHLKQSVGCTMAGMRRMSPHVYMQTTCSLTRSCRKEARSINTAEPCPFVDWLLALKLNYIGFVRAAFFAHLPPLFLFLGNQKSLLLCYTESNLLPRLPILIHYRSFYSRERRLSSIFWSLSSNLLHMFAL